jgi:hypothetical protein
MEDLLQKLIVAVVGGGLGIFGAMWTTSLRENVSYKREQLQNFYAPLEILLKINKQSFERYTNGATSSDKEFIEKNVWFPNNVKIREIIMGQSHHLARVPQEILDLLEHLEVWLSEYELVYVLKQKSGPVFAGTRGYPYPSKSDDFVIGESSRLRRALNRG